MIAMEEKILEKLTRIENLIAIGMKDALNSKEAAMLLGISYQGIIQMTHNKRLPHYKQGKRLYFSRKELEGWMLSNKIKTKEEIELEASKYLIRKKRV